MVEENIDELKGKWVDAETGETTEEPKPKPKEKIKRKTPEDYKEKKTLTPKDIEEEEKQEILDKMKKNNPDMEREYLTRAIDDSPIEIRQAIQYKVIGNKLKQGKVITEEEQQFMDDMNALIQQEKEVQEQAEQKEAEEQEKKEEILKEYEETKKLAPHKIMEVKQKEVSLRGGESLPATLKFILALKKAKKKGGKLIVKVMRERKVSFEWTNKEVSFVVFWTKDERGNDMQEVTRFSEYKYNFEGTPVPVLFAIQGYAEGFDFFDEFRKDITSEMVARISSRSYHTGYLEGINLRDKQTKKGTLEGLAPLMPIILIVGLLVLGWIMYQMYGEMQLLREAVEAVKNQAAPIVVGGN